VIGPPVDLPGSAADRSGRREATELLRRRLQAFLAGVAGPPAAADD
jgi:DNA-directed RNA polymerase specialized sigma24 family protein